MISFRRGKTKVRIITEERISTPQNTTPLYMEGVHMLDGITDEEVEHFLEEYPAIVPLEEVAYRFLKVMLSHAPVLQPLN